MKQPGFEELVERFNATLLQWERALDQYSSLELTIKPTPQHWSIGQVYQHLINDTRYYLQQANASLETEDNKEQESSPVASRMFEENAFPDTLLKGALSNDLVPQPRGKEEIIAGLLLLKREFEQTAQRASTSSTNGKTMHPGFHFFDARQWLQYAEMHLRHHLRQKARIDSYLTKQGL